MVGQALSFPGHPVVDQDSQSPCVTWCNYLSVLLGARRVESSDRQAAESWCMSHRYAPADGYLGNQHSGRGLGVLRAVESGRQRANHGSESWVPHNNAEKKGEKRKEKRREEREKENKVLLSVHMAFNVGFAFFFFFEIGAQTLQCGRCFCARSRRQTLQQDFWTNLCNLKVGR